MFWVVEGPTETALLSIKSWIMCLRVQESLLLCHHNEGASHIWVVALRWLTGSGIKSHLRSEVSSDQF